MTNDIKIIRNYISVNVNKCGHYFTAFDLTGRVSVRSCDGVASMIFMPLSLKSLIVFTESIPVRLFTTAGAFNAMPAVDSSDVIISIIVLFNRDARMNTMMKANTANIIQPIRSFAPNHENMLPVSADCTTGYCR